MKIDMAAGQTGSNRVSAHSTARHEMSMAITMFLMRPSSTMLSPRRQLKLHYTGNTHGGRPNRISIRMFLAILCAEIMFRFGRPLYLNFENMGIAVGISFLAVLCAKILLLKVWAATISIAGTTRLPVI